MGTSGDNVMYRYIRRQHSLLDQEDAGPGRERRQTQSTTKVDLLHRTGRSDALEEEPLGCVGSDPRWSEFLSAAKAEAEREL